VTIKKRIEVLCEGGRCSVILDKEDDTLSLVIPPESMSELWDVFVEAEKTVRELPNNSASLPIGKLCAFVETLLFSYSTAKTAYMAEHEDDPERRDAYAKLLEVNRMLRDLKKFHRPEK
jgi:hypothetical protein